MRNGQPRSADRSIGRPSRAAWSGWSNLARRGRSGRVRCSDGDGMVLGNFTYEPIPALKIRLRVPQPVRQVRSLERGPLPFAMDDTSAGKPLPKSLPASFPSASTTSCCSSQMSEPKELPRVTEIGSFNRDPTGSAPRTAPRWVAVKRRSLRPQPKESKSLNRRKQREQSSGSFSVVSVSSCSKCAGKQGSLLCHTCAVR